ncbi:O-antigen ligase family protein [Flavobacterium sp. N2270]|uniref:O-antigen ligase family protein n=1 Tax=Flavobacterium sp. N2270 TaxID=2986831 RepID=UPI0022248F52|nr:O-antigen ligase family protein [Flavobacterium sp. N2270]
MNKTSRNPYLFLIFFHLLLGAVVFALPFLAKIYSLLIVFFGYMWVIKNKNKNHEALIVSAYIVGAEVFLRMTEGGFISEYGKYNIILLMTLGILYRGFHQGSYVYLIYLFLLIPGVFYGVHTLSFDANIRKAIAFNISGPVSLGFSALYCYRKTISLKQFKKIFLAFGLPILSIVAYIILYGSNKTKVFLNTSSNHDASGGFGPNQMSTMLGFGMFVFFTIFYLFAKTKLEKFVTVVILAVVTFRGILTFSRGGVYVGIGMILILIAFTFFRINARAKMKVFVMILTGFALSIGIWTYTSVTTDGLIDKRYANQDASGKLKQSKLTGRETLIESELLMFWENPITGVGVGKNKEYREEQTGILLPTHNEISRTLAEHGFLGIVCLLIIFFTPLINFIDNKRNIFALSFFLFWILTINHAAMRLAAPGFVYALSVLNLSFNNEED